MASINAIPQKYTFPALLTDEQVMKICSASSNHAVGVRVLISILKLDSGEIAGVWEKNPEVLIDIIERSPTTIEEAKSLVGLLENARNRLLLIGDLAINGDDESEAIDKGAAPESEIVFTVDSETAANLDKFACELGCSRDAAATRLIHEELHRRLNPTDAHTDAH